MSTSKLLDLYHEDPSGSRTIVVQKLQDDVREDNLQNYLEVICIDELTDVYFPLEGCNVAIAVFEREIEAIQSWQDKAGKRKFEGSYLELQMLSQPDGIFIGNVPDGITEEYLSLYFESRKSGGEEDTVERVKLVDVSSVKTAFVEISSQNAIASILSKTPHLLRNKNVNLEPYYALVHQCLINSSRATATQNSKERNSSPVPDRIATFDRFVTHETTLQTQKQKHIQPCNSSTGDIHIAPHRESSPAHEKYISAAQITATDSNYDQESQSQASSKQKVKQGNRYSSDSRIPEPRVLCDSASGSAKSDFKLKIISDDPFDEELQVQNKWPGATLPQVYNREDASEIDNCTNNGPNTNRRTSVAAVKPVVRNIQRQVSNDSDDAGAHKRNPRRRGRNNGDGGQQAFDCEEEILLPSVQIIMLIIFRFQMKTQNDNLKVIFKEKDGKVIIKGSTDEDIRRAKLKLFECLDNVVCRSENVSPMRSTFLAREKCQKCLRARCINNKLRVAFEVNHSKRILDAYAFSDDDAERGISFVKEELTVMDIQLRPGQEQFLNEADWKAMIDSLDSGLTTVYPDETIKNIVIESFIEGKAKEAVGKIIQYLKQHVTKKSADVVLDSAKARCFKACHEEKLGREVVRKRGKFKIEEQSKSPFTIRIMVEGEESLVSTLIKMVSQIWLEKVDFGKISDRAEDKWLILKGLDCSTGTSFLRTFEKTHNCFIQVSRDGDFRLTKPRVQVDDSSKGHAADRNTESESDHFASDNEETNEELILYTRRKHKDIGQETQYLFQGRMSEDEAMSRAVGMSLEDRKDREFEGENLEDSDEDNIIFHNEIGDRKQKRSYMRPMPTRTRRENLYRSASTPVSVPSRSETLQMLNTQVILIQGEIVRQKAEALVNIVSPSHNLNESVVSKAFVRLAGQQIIQMYETTRASSQGTGTVLRTDSCGRLKCSSVLHVVLMKGEAYCLKMIQRAMMEVFQECLNQGYTSVAFPPLGVGRMYKYPPETVAERMLAETYRQIQSGIFTLNQIAFVVFDDATYTVFEKAFKTFNTGSRNMYRPTLQARPFYEQDPFRQSAVSSVPANSVMPPTLHAKHSHISTYEMQMQRMRRQAAYAAVKQARAAKRPEPQPKYRTSSSARDSSGTRTYRSRSQVEEDCAYTEERKSKQRRSPRSRFPERKTASNLTVIVVAENKDTCVGARNELGKRIRDEFLHEEKIDKRQKISEETKKKIINIIIKNDIESIKGKDRYILRGRKDKVSNARIEILELLLEEKESKELKRKRKGNVKRETQDFVKYMIEEEPEVPPYWKSYKPDVTLKSLLTTFKHAVTGKNYEKVELDRNGQTFSAIVKMINSTFDQSKIGQGQDARGLETLNYSQLFVVKIQRIENLDLYKEFTGVRQKLFLGLHKSREVKFPNIQNLPNCSGPILTRPHVKSSLDKDLHPEINEVLLFHGTKDVNVGTICSSGLDSRLGSGKAMFGSGIYGAECSTKADQYADDKTNRTAGQGNTKKLFLIRMLLGNSYLCNDQNPRKYRRPPCTSCFLDDCRDTRHAGNKFGHMFDSVVGDNGKLFREFVVYDGSLCYPEYLITYERR